MLHYSIHAPSPAELDAPTFYVRTKVFPLRYYVWARFEKGRRMKIIRFNKKEYALRWIEAYSEDWLHDYRARHLR